MSSKSSETEQPLQELRILCVAFLAINEHIKKLEARQSDIPQNTTTAIQGTSQVPGPIVKKQHEPLSSQPNPNPILKSEPRLSPRDTKPTMQPRAPRRRRRAAYNNDSSISRGMRWDINMDLEQELKGSFHGGLDLGFPGS